VDLLALKENENISTHNLFFVNSNKQYGIPTREEINDRIRSAETFANIFEIILTADKSRMDIIKKFFPISLDKIEKFLEGLR